MLRPPELSTLHTIVRVSTYVAAFDAVYCMQESRLQFSTEDMRHRVVSKVEDFLWLSVSQAIAQELSP